MHVLVCFISTRGLPVCVRRAVTSESFPCSPTICCCLAPHADVAGLAARVLLGVHRGHAHQLVPADLGHRARRQVHGLRVDDLQYDVLGVMEQQAAALALLHPLAGEERVVAHVEQREALLAEVVARGALRCQDQDNEVVGRVHAVEIPKVQVGVGVEERVGLDLEAVAAVGGVLRRLAGVELCVAAEEEALQLPTDRRAVAAAVVLHRRQHSVLLLVPGVRTEEKETCREQAANDSSASLWGRSGTNTAHLLSFNKVLPLNQLKWFLNCQKAEAPLYSVSLKYHEHCRDSMTRGAERTLSCTFSISRAVITLADSSSSSLKKNKKTTLFFIILTNCQKTKAASRLQINKPPRRANLISEAPVMNHNYMISLQRLSLYS